MGVIIMNKKQVLSLTGAALATVAGVSVANEDVNADVKTTTGNAQTQQVQYAIHTEPLHIEPYRKDSATTKLA